MMKDYAVFFNKDFKSFKKGQILCLSNESGAHAAISSKALEGNLEMSLIHYLIKHSFREVDNLEAVENEDTGEWEVILKPSFKGPEIEKKYEEMTAEVYLQMQAVFGTQDPNSASAYKQTWDMMVQSPSSFSGAGLTSRFEVAGLSIGDALDTDQKVTDYATACVDAAIQYGIWRMQRIEQFRQERADILAGKSV